MSVQLSKSSAPQQKRHKGYKNAKTLKQPQKYPLIVLRPNVIMKYDNVL